MLGWQARFADDVRGWAGWRPGFAERALFLIGLPEYGNDLSPGIGRMTAFACVSAAMVDAAYSAALKLGAHCNGAPGPRPSSHATYYGAYVRDPFGTKIAFACHAWAGNLE